MKLTDVENRCRMHDRSDKDIQREFSLPLNEVAGGGMIAYDRGINLLQIGWSSMAFGAVPETILRKFGAILKEYLSKNNIPIDDVRLEIDTPIHKSWRQFEK